MFIKRSSLITAFILIAFVFQITPALSGFRAAAVSRCNWVGFVADVTIPA